MQKLTTEVRDQDRRLQNWAQTSTPIFGLECAGRKEYNSSLLINLWLIFVLEAVQAKYTFTSLWRYNLLSTLLASTCLSSHHQNHQHDIWPITHLSANFSLPPSLVSSYCPGQIRHNIHIIIHILLSQIVNSRAVKLMR